MHVIVYHLQHKAQHYLPLGRSCKPQLVPLNVYGMIVAHIGLSKTCLAGTPGAAHFDDISKFPRDAIPDGQHVYTINELETWTHMPWLALAAGAKIIVPRHRDDSPSIVQVPFSLRS